MSSITIGRTVGNPHAQPTRTLGDNLCSGESRMGRIIQFGKGMTAIASHILTVGHALVTNEGWFAIMRLLGPTSHGLSIGHVHVWMKVDQMEVKADHDGLEVSQQSAIPVSIGCRPEA